MAYTYKEVATAAKVLKKEFEGLTDKKAILKSNQFKKLFGHIKTLPAKDKSKFGSEVNALKKEVQSWLESINNIDKQLPPIDVTAPFDVNTPVDKKPSLLSGSQGTIHPLTKELDEILDIFYRMGFEAVESRELDDDYHMFESLNFPEGHPAKDDFDTFTTTEGLLASAHTSTMQNRVLKKYKNNLEESKAISVVIPGRCFRNEDVDARHDHTFYHIEGVYVNKGVHTGNLIAVLKTFLQEYYQKEIEVKMQPFYFPFTEPSFEFTLSCPFCDKKGCNICGSAGWIELLGCGMIHPNVLKMAGIDPTKYTGFAWGCGIDRLVMMKYDIEDIRYFHSAKLDFLEQF
jgi:phenylalanyl-tRNA synthetase alpha chain